LSPFATQELAKLAAIHDLDERDDAFSVMMRQKQAEAAAAKTQGDACDPGVGR
jgi:hypothetical protein